MESLCYLKESCELVDFAFTYAGVISGVAAAATAAAAAPAVVKAGCPSTGCNGCWWHGQCRDLEQHPAANPQTCDSQGGTWCAGAWRIAAVAESSDEIRAAQGSHVEPTPQAAMEQHAGTQPSGTSFHIRAQNLHDKAERLRHNLDGLTFRVEKLRDKYEDDLAEMQSSGDSDSDKDQISPVQKDSKWQRRLRLMAAGGLLCGLGIIALFIQLRRCSRALRSGEILRKNRNRPKSRRDFSVLGQL